MKRGIIFVSILVSLGISPVFPDDLAKTKLPEKRVAELEEEVKSLKAEVARLKNALTTTQASLKAAEEAGFVEGPGFSSFVDILRKLPENLQPHPVKGWDKFVVEDAYKWLQKQPVGERFDAKLKVENVRVSKNTTSTKLPYSVVITCSSRNFKYSGVAFIQKIGVLPFPFSIQGDEAFARKAEKLKPGDFVQVSGKISSIQLSNQFSGRLEVNIHLSDQVLTAPELQR